MSAAKVTSTYMAADSASTAADNSADSGYECAECGKVFRRDATLRRHRELCHDDAASRRSYRCQTCRRPFISRATLDSHVSVTHGSAEPSTTTMKRPASGVGVGRQLDSCSDGELVLVEDCCVDDEICITADGGEFQTTEECDDNHVAEKNFEQLSHRHGNNINVSCTSQISADSSASGAACTTVPHCNNNNTLQTKNKNVLPAVHPAAGVVFSASYVNQRPALRSTVGPPSVVRSSAGAVKLPVVTSGTSAVQGLNGVAAFRTALQPATTTTSAAVSSPAVPPCPSGTSRLVSVCRAAEAPKSAAVTRAATSTSQRTAANTAVLQQKTPRSPLEAETFHGDAHKPGDVGPLLSGLTPTSSTTQKIIVYVKTEAGNHAGQQIAYCAAESTTSGSGAGKGSAGMPCQFVCPVCGRDFASEKYLSMHVSSIHRAAADVASVIALETAAAAAPTSVCQKVSVSAGSPQSVGDVAVALTATASGTLQAAVQPSSSTSVGGSKSHWTCNICKKAFAQNSSYKNHIRTHSDDRPYVCSICSIGFKERYHLKKHELFKHTTTLNETCRICGKRFKDSTAVRAHERIHSDVRPYGCTLCGKTFKTSECLWHHENRSKTCGKMASRNVNRHLTVAGVVTVPQQRPPRRTAINHAVNAVPTTAHQLYQTAVITSPRFQTVEEEDVKPELADLKPLEVECVKEEDAETEECSPELVESPDVVDDSDDLVIKTEPSECELFDDVNLNTMILDSSDADTAFTDFWPTFYDLDSVTPPEYDAGNFPSSPDPMCSSPDTTDADSTRSADESIPALGSTLSSSSDLGGGVKRYDCARCDKRFASAATLTKHLQVHAEVRPHRCGVCDIGFKLKVHLKKHNLYRHSEEYPCECSICGKRFKDSSAVRLHERIHSTARPFQCLHCGKSFKTRENLWGHRNRGPCEQRSLLVTSPITSYPVPASTTSNITAPAQFVASNVRLFHSPEFGPILGVPVNAKLVFKDGEKATAMLDDKPATVAAVQQLNVNHVARSTTTSAPISLLTGTNANNGLRRVSAIRVGDTPRLAVSKMTTTSSIGGAGLSLVSAVPTAVVTPIKRDMIGSDPQKITSLVATTSTSVLAEGNLVLPATNHGAAGQLTCDRKRSVVELCAQDAGGAAVTSPHKYLAVADNGGKVSGIQRLLSTPTSSSGGETLLSPNMEQNLADALSALASVQTVDAMVVEGDCLPPISESEETATNWPPASTDYDEDDSGGLDVRDDDWSELVAASCDQLLTSTEDTDDDALSDGDYQRLISTNSSLGPSVTSRSPGTAEADDESGTGASGERTAELASDTMWCNWAPENDLGSLLIFGP